MTSGVPAKRNVKQSRVAEPADYGGLERSEREAITRAELGRWRAVFGAGAVIACPERNRGPLPHVIGRERATARQSDLDLGAGPLVDAVETGGDVAASLAIRRSPGRR